MTEDLLVKINALAKKEKEQGLTKEEKELQQKLREEYRVQFRSKFKTQLSNVDVKLPDGTVVPLTQLQKKNKK